jgi:SAM-dependent methyltransferase
VSAPRPGGYKTALIDSLFSDFDGERARVLDLGCGTGVNFASALERHRNVSYTGVEQHRPTLARARDTIGHLPNVELYEGFGEGFRGCGFDLVMSLSVLEHVKHLDHFLAVSVEATREGGRIVHRYDLGHALSPATVGERLRVAVAKRVPALVPRARFTTYPNLEAIVSLLSALGVVAIEVTQSQMPSLKAAMNLLNRTEDEELASRLVDLDAALWDQLSPRVSPEQRDRLFPAVTVSGYRTAKPNTDAPLTRRTELASRLAAREG